MLFCGLKLFRIFYYMWYVQVNISLAAAQARLHNAREERDQFYEANDQIVTHLKSKV